VEGNAPVALFKGFNPGNLQQDFALAMQLAAQAEQFMTGQPVTLNIPPESYTVPIANGISVKVSESGTTAMIQKV